MSEYLPLNLWIVGIQNNHPPTQMGKERQQLGHVLDVHNLLGLLLQSVTVLALILEPFISYGCNFRFYKCHFTS